MKNIVKFEIVKPQGNVYIDGNNPIFSELSFKEVLNQLLPYTRIFENIYVRNFTAYGAELLSRLTNQYLHGCNIVFETPSRKFEHSFKLNNAPAFYSYKWVPLDLSKPVPRSLADFKFKYRGEETTYLQAIKSLHNTTYLPNEIWVALDTYSQNRINQCRRHNQGDYEMAELWYKDLMKLANAHGIKCFSPNKKTYYEVTAELIFEKDCKVFQQAVTPLTDQELAFLQANARAYGISIPKFQWRINTRKTDHGYTQEPEVCYLGMSASDISRATYDPRNNNNLPKFARHGLQIKELDNTYLLRQAYDNLMWIINNCGDDMLMDGYKRCPKCGELHLESQGCGCGYCKPIEYISADNLLYGISSTYEDYSSTGCAYSDINEELE